MKEKNNLKPELLAVSKRGTIIENLYSGWICVVNKDKKVVYRKGNVNDSAFLRSCAKPVQAIPVIESDIKLTQKELAIICGSHTGSKYHQAVLKEIIKKIT
jgi:L-asparaginase II